MMSFVNKNRTLKIHHQGGRNVAFVDDEWAVGGWWRLVKKNTHIHSLDSFITIIPAHLNV